MERVMSELATYFITKNDLELHLVLYGITREIFYKVPDYLIVHKPQFRFNNKWRLYFTVKTVFYIRHAIKRIDPDTILSFGELWNSLHLKPKKAKTNPYTGKRESCYVSYPWEDIRETREKNGLKWYVIGNPWVWKLKFSFEGAK